MILRPRMFLIDAREAAHLTRSELARRAEISVGLVRFLEEDNLSVTHPNIADRIADVLSLSTDRRNAMVDPIHHKPNSKHRKKPPVKRRLGDYSINRQTTGRAGR